MNVSVRFLHNRFQAYARGKVRKPKTECVTACVARCSALYSTFILIYAMDSFGARRVSGEFSFGVPHEPMQMGRNKHLRGCACASTRVPFWGWAYHVAQKCSQDSASHTREFPLWHSTAVSLIQWTARLDKARTQRFRAIPQHRGFLFVRRHTLALGGLQCVERVRDALHDGFAFTSRRPPILIGLFDPPHVLGLVPRFGRAALTPRRP